MSKCKRKPDAKAVIKGSEKYPSIHGAVWFRQEADAVWIEAQICGLPENETGFYGFHIHEGGDCEDDFSHTGAHWNPDEKAHPSHSGDLPVLMSYGGRAYMQVKSDRFRVREVIGRTVIIHDKADDYRTQPSGDSGEKIACGKIMPV